MTEFSCFDHATDQEGGVAGPRQLDGFSEVIKSIGSQCGEHTEFDQSHRRCFEEIQKNGGWLQSRTLCF